MGPFEWRLLGAGGGIRDHATIKLWLDKGVSRVILGTAALKNPHFVKEACANFPGQVAIGIDAKAGFVAVEGSSIAIFDSWSKLILSTSITSEKTKAEETLGDLK